MSLVTTPSQPETALHRIFYGRHELRAGWRLLIFLAIVATTVSAINFALGSLLRGAGNDARFLAREIEDFLVVLLASWIMGRLEHRTIADYGLPARRMFRARFWQGCVLGFAAITVLLIAMRACGVIHFQGIALHGAAVWRWGGIYTFVFLLVAFREEFRARGYMLYTITTGLGFWPAAILTSAFFGYSHHGNSGEDWIGLFNAGAFGLLLCFIVRRTGDLWLPIGLHTAFDWGETYFYGVADSGQVLPGHLLNTTTTGAAWLSGGTVGPEGSVLATLLVIVLFVVCAAWLRDVKYDPPHSRLAAKPIAGAPF